MLCSDHFQSKRFAIANFALDDFFLGIGDINGTFLPPTSTNISPSGPGLPAATQTPPPLAASAESPTSTTSSPMPATPSESLSTAEEGLLLQAKLLDEVSEARPLAKLQEELEKDELDISDISDPEDGHNVDGANNTIGPQEQTKETEVQPLTPPKHRKQLLNAFDNELDRVSSVGLQADLMIQGKHPRLITLQILRSVHREFYSAYDDRTSPEDIPLGCDTGVSCPSNCCVRGYMTKTDISVAVDDHIGKEIKSPRWL